MRFLARLLSAITTLVFISLAVLIGVNNAQSVTFGLWPFDGVDLPLWLLVMSSFAIGLVLGGMAMLMPLFSSRLAERAALRKITVLEEKIARNENEDGVRRHEPAIKLNAPR